MLDIMYEIPSRDDIEKCIITKNTILNEDKPNYILKDKTSKSIESSENAS